MNKRGKKVYLDRTFCSPAVIIVAIATQVPFILTIILSFIKWNLIRPDQGMAFTGIKNYIYYLTTSEFWIICLQTIGIIGASLLL